MSDLKIVVSASREFAFSASDFNRVKQMIHARAGISLNDSKENMVYSRLSRRLRMTGDQTFSDYLDRLERPDDSEWQAFINALTTNLTSFFRESHHFPILAHHLKALEKLPQINIWCCAASTGEEPYSIAMTAIDTLALPQKVRIVATDIDTSVLKTASDGVYAEELVRRIDPVLLKRHFLAGSGQFSGLYKIKPEVQSLVTFQRLNLLDRNWLVPKGIDVIFCRNVMIYFDRTTQTDILTRFAPHMNSGALLFAGHSENFQHCREHFQLMGKTVYLVRKQDRVRDAA